MNNKKLKINKKGFTLIEIIISLAILTIIMSPIPVMIAKIIKFQIKEEARNLIDINEIFNEMERDFLYINGHNLDYDNNGFDGNENFYYRLEPQISNYFPLKNNLLKIKTFYNCEITYQYDSINKIFSKTINNKPVDVDCGRELKVYNIKTMEFNKIDSIILFDLKITKDWDIENNYTQFIKIRPFI